MNKLIRDWTEKEVEELRNTVIRELCVFDIIDIRVCGSYCHGANDNFEGGLNLKDLDLVVIVKNDLVPDKDNDNRRQLRWPVKFRFNGIPVDIWIYEPDNRRCEMFAIGGYEFDLPWYSIMGGKHNEGKDLEKWRKVKREGFTKLEMKDDRVWNGHIVMSKYFKLIDVPGGKGVVKI